MFCVCILLNYHFSIKNNLNYVYKNLFFGFQWFLLEPELYHLIRIRIFI